MEAKVPFGRKVEEKIAHNAELSVSTFHRTERLRLNEKNKARQDFSRRALK
jgi:hypothetical protein